MQDNITPAETPEAKRKYIMFSNWSGAHWAIVVLMGLLGAEHVPQVADALGSAADGVAIAVTTGLLGLFGVSSAKGVKWSS